MCSHFKDFTKSFWSTKASEALSETIASEFYTCMRGKGISIIVAKL